MLKDFNIVATFKVTKDAASITTLTINDASPITYTNKYPLKSRIDGVHVGTALAHIGKDIEEEPPQWTVVFSGDDPINVEKFFEDTSLGELLTLNSLEIIRKVLA